MKCNYEYIIFQIFKRLKWMGMNWTKYIWKFMGAQNQRSIQYNVTSKNKKLYGNEWLIIQQTRFILNTWKLIHLMNTKYHCFKLTSLLETIKASCARIDLYSKWTCWMPSAKKNVTSICIQNSNRTLQIIINVQLDDINDSKIWSVINEVFNMD
jgi:hypothetical protein